MVNLVLSLLLSNKRWTDEYLILFEGLVANNKDKRFQPAPQFRSSIYKTNLNILIIHVAFTYKKQSLYLLRMV